MKHEVTVKVPRERNKFAVFSASEGCEKLLAYEFFEAIAELYKRAGFLNKVYIEIEGVPFSESTVEIIPKSNLL